MTSGSCLCGNAAYEFSAEVRGVIHCHCITCRKAHGSAFSSVARVPAAEFRLTGDKYLECFESSPGKHRHFCSNCGTHIYAKRDGRDHVILRLGSLDTQLGAKEVAHTWMSDSADWFDLDSDLPRYEEGVRDLSREPDVEYNLIRKMSWVMMRRVLPLGLAFTGGFIGIAGMAISDDLAPVNAGLLIILWILVGGGLAACWYLLKSPLRLRLTPSSLVASGALFEREYPLTCIVGIYTHPYSGLGYFEVSFNVDGAFGSMRLFDGPGRDLFKRALLERAPWVKDFGV